MSGTWCKHLLNGGYPVAAQSVEKTVNEARAAGKIPADQGAKMIQTMADIDIEAYRRLATEVMKPLEKAGVYSADIWEIFNDPTRSAG